MSVSRMLSSISVAAVLVGFAVTTLFVFTGFAPWSPMDAAKTAAARETVSIVYFATLFAGGIVAAAFAAWGRFVDYE